MPVTSTILSGAIWSQMTLRRLVGKNSSDIASSVGTAIAQYIIVPNLVTCTLSGTAGPAGIISSTAVVGLVPTAMSSLMLSKAVLKRLTGRDIRTLFDAISMGVVMVLSTMYLSGTSAGCAIGAGVGKFTAINEKALSGLIWKEFLRRKLTGKNNRDLADCVAFGVIKHLQTTVFFSVLVAGAIAPVPPAGPVPVIGIPSLTTKVS